MVNEPFSSPFIKYNLISSKPICEANTRVGNIMSTRVAKVFPEKYQSFRDPSPLGLSRDTFLLPGSAKLE